MTYKMASSYLEIVTYPYYDPKDGQFEKHCHMQKNYHFLRSEPYLKALSVKLILNPITHYPIKRLLI